ncbi:MAG: hypothetical protein NVSMB33_08160 [Ktedonobacteraceae bacterium]
MRNMPFKRLLFLCSGCMLMLLLAACGSGNFPTPTTASTPTSVGTTSVAHSTPTSSGGSGTTSLPPTSTGCPAPGTARAAVMTSLALGSHANLVYSVNQGTIDTPRSGILKRYDVVTGSKTEIVNLPSTYIAEAQISADGQWILFVAHASAQTKLQLVRIDGQELQTLVCSGSGSAQNIFSPQWSANQRLVVFGVGGQPTGGVDLLNMSSGTLQVELPVIQTVAFRPRTWLDNTRVYLTNLPTDGPANSLYMLDTSRGPNQDYHKLQRVFDATQTSFCWNFDSSYDSKYLYTSQCNAIGNTTRPGIASLAGPGHINVQPITGGSPTNAVYASQNSAITNVRAFNSNMLLFSIGNTNGTTSSNGLWEVEIDGSHLRQVTKTVGDLNTFSQYPWSDVSRDGSMYALQQSNDASHTYNILFGSMSGGTPTTATSINDGTQLATVGWTTM